MRIDRFLPGLLFGLAVVGSWATPSYAAPSLIPLPAHVQAMPGQFVLRAGTPLVAAGDVDSQRTARFLTARINSMRGMKLLQALPGGKAVRGGIVLSIDPHASLAAEGYALDVTPQGVHVLARDGAGLFHGAVTLWQLFADDAASRALPAVHVDDAPRFAWRGLMLDSARHFQTISEVRTLIDQMALHKLNVLHWHLTDDQGWRIQIRRYPELTRIGAWRTPPDAGHGGEPHRYGGFYTQEQIRSLVRYAADRYITVVPEIDLPGHATAAVASYPQLGVTGTRPPVSIDWGVNTTLYSPDSATIHFMEQVLDEVMALFPSRYIHLGGDEAVKDQWQASPAVQAQIKRLGLGNEDALQSWMMGQLGAYLRQHGRRMLGWDEILQGGVPADAIVMSWNGVKGAVEAARRGHDVVLSPSPDLYFDQLQSARDDEGTGRVPVESLAAVYAFEPVPKELGADEVKHVLGAQANVWTEHMPDMRHVEHAVFPRLDALAEAVWTPPTRRNWPDFLARLPTQLRRYSRSGIAWADSAFAADVRFDRARALASGKATILLSNQARFGTLRYTLDGSAPTVRSPAYVRPFDVQLPATVRATTYAADGTVLAAARSQRIDVASLLSRNGNQLLNCPGSTFRLRTQPLPDATTWMPVYEVPLFDSCQIYAAAPLDGVTALQVELARLPRNYSLAHEQKRVVSHAAATPHGELLVRRDDCNGALLATLSLPDPASAPRRFALKHALPAGQGTHDLCLLFTAPVDGPIYVFDRVSLQRGAGSP